MKSKSQKRFEAFISAAKRDVNTDIGVSINKGIVTITAPVKILEIHQVA